jgi:hypothetical protein
VLWLDRAQLEVAQPASPFAPAVGQPLGTFVPGSRFEQMGSNMNANAHLLSSATRCPSHSGRHSWWKRLECVDLGKVLTDLMPQRLTLEYCQTMLSNRQPLSTNLLTQNIHLAPQNVKLSLRSKHLFAFRSGRIKVERLTGDSRYRFEPLLDR